VAGSEVAGADSIVGIVPTLQTAVDRRSRTSMYALP
jgi:hypothetical protein